MAKIAARRKSTTQGETEKKYNRFSILNKNKIRFFFIFKLWNARLAGYEECGKLFAIQDSSKSGEFEDYLDLIPRFATDTNENAKEKGLEALLVFIQEAYVART